MTSERTEVHSIFTARSNQELVDYLRSQDITVPPRTGGRKSQHCERYGTFRFLATLATIDRLEYPVTVIHQDKPDFLLQFPRANVGLEFTLATSQELAEIDALAEQTGKAMCLPLDQFAEGAPKRSTAERRAILENRPRMGDGWVDDEPDREWKIGMMNRIRRKTNDLRGPHSTRCKENWLLIYDDLTVNFLATPEKAALLNRELESYFREQCCYDVVFIESVGELLEFTSGGCTKQQINDVWNQDKAPE